MKKFISVNKSAYQHASMLEASSIVLPRMKYHLCKGDIIFFDNAECNLFCVSLNRVKLLGALVRVCGNTNTNNHDIEFEFFSSLLKNWGYDKDGKFVAVSHSNAFQEVLDNCGTFGDFLTAMNGKRLQVVEVKYFLKKDLNGRIYNKTIYGFDFI